MKCIVILALCLVAACVVVSGCQTTKESRNTTPSPAFEPFHLRQGQVTVYVNGLTGEFPVIIDNLKVGAVSITRPFTMTLNEGNSTVEVCCGVRCVHQNIDIRFGKPGTLDFSEQLEKECEFLEPTVRITDYFLSGDQITVNVEFINPTAKELTMSAEIRCVYSYIDSGNNRYATSAIGWAVSTLKPGAREIQTLRLNTASGSNYIFGTPTINQVSKYPTSV